MHINDKKRLPVTLLLSANLFYDRAGGDARAIESAGEAGLVAARRDFLAGVSAAVQRGYHNGTLLSVDECPEGIYVEHSSLCLSELSPKTEPALLHTANDLLSRATPAQDWRGPVERHDGTLLIHAVNWDIATVTPKYARTPEQARANADLMALAPRLVTALDDQTVQNADLLCALERLLLASYPCTVAADDAACSELDAALDEARALLDPTGERWPTGTPVPGQLYVSGDPNARPSRYPHGSREQRAEATGRSEHARDRKTGVEAAAPEFGTPGERQAYQEGRAEGYYFHPGAQQLSERRAAEQR